MLKLMQLEVLQDIYVVPSGNYLGLGMTMENFSVLFTLFIVFTRLEIRYILRWHKLCA